MSLETVRTEIKNLNLAGINAITVRKEGLSEFPMTLIISFHDATKDVTFYAPRDASEDELLYILRNFPKI